MAAAGDNGPDRRPTGQAAPFSLRARQQSFVFALAGGRVLLAQHNAWIHAAATLLVVVLGLVCRVSRLEWVALALAIELLADEVSLEQRERLGRAKDVAAFAVLIAALAAVAVGLLVFWPHLFNR